MTQNDGGAAPRDLDFDTYLKALALYTLAAQRMSEMLAIEAALSRLLGFEQDRDSPVYMGHISDKIYEGADSVVDFNGACRAQGFVIPDAMLAARNSGGADV